MFVLKVFIFKLFSVYGLSTCSISFCKVSTLGHKTWDNPVVGAALEVKGFTRFSNTLFTCAKSPEVFGSSWSVSKQLNLNSAYINTSNANIEENLGHLVTFL